MMRLPPWNLPPRSAYTLSTAGTARRAWTYGSAAQQDISYAQGAPPRVYRHSQGGSYHWLWCSHSRRA